MLLFWRFLNGYLKISFCGDNSPLLLNAAVKNRVKIWDLKYKNNCITGNILIKDFLKLRKIKRGIKCSVKILEKKGLVFHTKKYVNRIGFFCGAALFFIILYILSNFVWIININGNKLLTDKEILNSCKEIGVFEGKNKGKINCKYDAQRLMLQQKNIAWCSLNIEGSILTVNLTEVKSNDKKEREAPSNIVASSSGIISKIDAKSGNVAVKIGDTVAKGDLLVSGIVNNMSSTLFVHSDATVTAQTVRTYSAQADYIQEINSVIKTKTHKTVDFFGVKMPLYLGSVKGECNYSKSVENCYCLNKRIPISIATEKYELLSNKMVEYTYEQLYEILFQDIENQVKSDKLISYKETNRNAVSTEKGILLTVTYSCEENIALQNEILLDTQN